MSRSNGIINILKKRQQSYKISGQEKLNKMYFKSLIKMIGGSMFYSLK